MSRHHDGYLALHNDLNIAKDEKSKSTFNTVTHLTWLYCTVHSCNDVSDGLIDEVIIHLKISQTENENIVCTWKLWADGMMYFVLESAWRM